MKKKQILIALFLGGGISICLVLLSTRDKGRSSNKDDLPTKSQATDSLPIKMPDDAVPEAIEKKSLVVVQTNLQGTETVSVEVESPDVAGKIEALEKAATETDPANLQLIVRELANPERKIRQAALEAAKDFGSREAIPTLKKIAEESQDPREKVEFLDAIQFLELPTLTEIRQQIKAAKVRDDSAGQPFTRTNR